MGHPRSTFHSRRPTTPDAFIPHPPDARRFTHRTALFRLSDVEKINQT